MEHLALATPVAASQIMIRALTNRDHPLLSKVKQFVQQGWPERVEGESMDMQPYKRRKNEFSLRKAELLLPHNSVIVWSMTYMNFSPRNHKNKIFGPSVRMVARNRCRVGEECKKLSQLSVCSSESSSCPTSPLVLSWGKCFSF